MWLELLWVTIPLWLGRIWIVLSILAVLPVIKELRQKNNENEN